MLSPWSRAIWPVFLVFILIPAVVSGEGSPVPTRGFEVDTSDRNEVVSFYQRVYMASEGYQDRIGWTGNYSSTAAGAEGTVSAVFSGDIERRLNYYRAMCGLKADVRVNSGATVNIVSGDEWVPPANTTKSAAAQRSALMIIRTYPGNAGLSHDPPNTATAWTTAAWNANRNGNLALGFFGPGAVDAYFKEDVTGTSAWNVDVGHRRWLMFQWSTDFASGDTPGSFTPGSGSVRPPSNTMYVIPKLSELDFSPDVIFASFPSAGYFPARLNASFWSLSYPSADFSAATVSLKDSAMNSVPVTIVSRRTGYGDNSIVWQVPAAAAVKSVTSDKTWNVTVSNIRGEGVPAQHSYQVTLIDPDRLNETPVISGNSSPVGSASDYAISGVPGADKMEAGIFLRSESAWNEGAEESPVSKVVDGTDGSYPLRAATPGYVKSGAKVFRLTFPTRYDPFINGVPAQHFELGRELVPGASGTLNFQFRRGLMTPASKLAVETSSDDGLTWTLLGSPWSGTGGAGDSAFQSASVNLPVGLSPLRVRFRYYLSDAISPLYAHEDYPTQPTGIFIDDITTSDCDWLQPTGSVSGAALASFTLDAGTAGMALASGQEWWLRARAILGGKAFAYGPAKIVTPSGPLQLMGPEEPPVSGADYDFIPDPAADSYLLEVSTLANSEVWTEGAESSPLPQVSSDTGNYALSSNLTGYRKSGAFAFRLGLSTLDDEEDSFTVERRVIPTAASTLNFWYRRGPMSLTNRLHVELSTDEGATWTSISNIAGTKKADKVLSLRSIPLAAWAEQPVKLRFAVRKDVGGVNLKWNAKKSGIWIDDITVTSPSDVLASNTVAVPGAATKVRLDDTAAGGDLIPGLSVRMRLRSVNGSTPGAWGPPLVVVPSDAASPLIGVPGGFAAWQAEYPELELSFEGDADRDGLADGIEYAFSLDPGDGVRIPDRFELQAGLMSISRDLPVERADVNYGAEWSDDLGTWSADGVEILIGNGEIRANAPQGGGRRFMRWNVGVR